MAQQNIHTIYHAMNAKGFFDSNPANIQSRDGNDGSSLYRGPQKYPRMFYHPEGEEKITKAAVAVATPFGPEWIGEQRELIYQIAHNVEDERRLRKEGWHDHPADAIAASGRVPPPKSSDDRIKSLEEQLAALDDERVKLGLEREAHAREQEELRALREENARLVAASQGLAPLVPKAPKGGNALLGKQAE